MTLGEKIKKLRLQKELSQAELAKAAGISLRSLQNYEANAFPPRYQRVYVSLAQALDCDVNYLKSDTSDFIITAAAKIRSARRPASSGHSRPDCCHVRWRRLI